MVKDLVERYSDLDHEPRELNDLEGNQKMIS